MSELSDAATIRRLPGGELQQARIIRISSDRLSVLPAGNNGDSSKGAALEAGALVEVGSSGAIYLGRVLERQPDSLLTVVVEHFIDLAALEEIEKAWLTEPD